MTYNNNDDFFNGYDGRILDRTGSRDTDGKPLDLNKLDESCSLSSFISNKEEYNDRKQGMMTMIKNAKEGLTEKQLYVLESIHENGKTQSEVAHILGVKQQVVAKHLHRAVLKVKQYCYKCKQDVTEL